MQEIGTTSIGFLFVIHWNVWPEWSLRFKKHIIITTIHWSLFIALRRNTTQDQVFFLFGWIKLVDMNSIFKTNFNFIVLPFFSFSIESFVQQVQHNLTVRLVVRQRLYHFIKLKTSSLQKMSFYSLSVAHKTVSVQALSHIQGMHRMAVFYCTSSIEQKPSHFSQRAVGKLQNHLGKDGSHLEKRRKRKQRRVS